MRYDKRSALSVILKAAEEYEKNLRDNNLLFVLCDKHKKISYFEVEFNSGNFMHLTGTRFSNEYKAILMQQDEERYNEKTDITYANKFYEKCLNKRMSVDDFEFAEDGTTPLKLDVLPALMKKNLSANSVGDFSARTVKLYTDKIAGNSKGCMGFIHDRGSDKNIPNTVLKSDIRDCASEYKRILITYRKKKSETHYNEIVYVAKKIEWDKIVFPEEYSYLPKPTTERN